MSVERAFVELSEHVTTTLSKPISTSTPAQLVELARNFTTAVNVPSVTRLFEHFVRATETLTQPPNPNNVRTTLTEPLYEYATRVTSLRPDYSDMLGAQPSDTDLRDVIAFLRDPVVDLPPAQPPLSTPPRSIVVASGARGDGGDDDDAVSLVTKTALDKMSTRQLEDGVVRTMLLFQSQCDVESQMAREVFGRDIDETLEMAMETLQSASDKFREGENDLAIKMVQNVRSTMAWLNALVRGEMGTNHVIVAGLDTLIHKIGTVTAHDVQSAITSFSTFRRTIGQEVLREVDRKIANRWNTGTDNVSVAGGAYPRDTTTLDDVKNDVIVAELPPPAKLPSIPFEQLFFYELSRNPSDDRAALQLLVMYAADYIKIAPEPGFALLSDVPKAATQIEQLNGIALNRVLSILHRAAVAFDRVIGSASMSNKRGVREVVLADLALNRECSVAEEPDDTGRMRMRPPPFDTVAELDNFVMSGTGANTDLALTRKLVESLKNNLRLVNAARTLFFGEASYSDLPQSWTRVQEIFFDSIGGALRGRNNPIVRDLASAAFGISDDEGLRRELRFMELATRRNRNFEVLRGDLVSASTNFALHQVASGMHYTTRPTVRRCVGLQDADPTGQLGLGSVGEVCFLTSRKLRDVLLARGAADDDDDDDDREPVTLTRYYAITLGDADDRTEVMVHDETGIIRNPAYLRLAELKETVGDAAFGFVSAQVRIRDSDYPQAVRLLPVDPIDEEPPTSPAPPIQEAIDDIARRNASRNYVSSGETAYATNITASTLASATNAFAAVTSTLNSLLFGASTSAVSVAVAQPLVESHAWIATALTAQHLALFILSALFVFGDSPTIRQAVTRINDKVIEYLVLWPVCALLQWWNASGKKVTNVTQVSTYAVFNMLRNIVDDIGRPDHTTSGLIASARQAMVRLSNDPGVSTVRKAAAMAARTMLFGVAIQHSVVSTVLSSNRTLRNYGAPVFAFLWTTQVSLFAVSTYSFGWYFTSMLEPITGVVAPVAGAVLDYAITRLMARRPGASRSQIMARALLTSSITVPLFARTAAYWAGRPDTPVSNLARLISGSPEERAAFVFAQSVSSVATFFLLRERETSLHYTGLALARRARAAWIRRWFGGGGGGSASQAPVTDAAIAARIRQLDEERKRLRDTLPNIVERMRRTIEISKEIKRLQR